ncbi:MAG TPA: nuclease-related domain-containing protein [Streptosporangiaceae bacterium]|nr:nuclease-related domain-containing protein [Streptosporangiaceae bacterium]
MDAEVEKAADRSTTTDDDQQSWRSWFGKGIKHVAADGADEDADDPDADDLDTDELAAALETSDDERARPRRLRRPFIGGEAKVSFPLTVRPLIHPRLRADPRWRVWITRAVICLILFIAVSMWKDWRFGLTAAVIYACADTVYRSKTTGITPTAVRVTSAQRSTARRLRVLQTAGYLALHARTIPGTDTVIDHVVVGPSGVFTVDSQRMDKRLPVRAIGGMLFHGPVSQDEKIDHARFEAERAAVVLANELGQRIRVRPAMVVYGPSVPWVIMRLKGVDVFDGRHVGAYFRKQSKATAGHHLDTAQVALVFAAAAHALPAIR